MPLTRFRDALIATSIFATAHHVNSELIFDNFSVPLDSITKNNYELVQPNSHFKSCNW
ncbi:MAG: hypothetical protein HRT47_03740 [Candidatus Caenarcaniphilales bacterium]|nr:hypothetical protein [Candidatus Caenarcaniphilales bacterium]